jgi:hypothetical protein
MQHATATCDRKAEMIRMPRTLHLSQKSAERLHVLYIERLGAGERHRQTVREQRITIPQTRELRRDVTASPDVIFRRYLQKIQPCGELLDQFVEKLPAQPETHSAQHFIFISDQKIFFLSDEQVPAPQLAAPEAAFFPDLPLLFLVAGAAAAAAVVVVVAAGVVAAALLVSAVVGVAVAAAPLAAPVDGVVIDEGAALLAGAEVSVLAGAALAAAGSVAPAAVGSAAGLSPPPQAMIALVLSAARTPATV